MLYPITLYTYGPYTYTEIRYRRLYPVAPTGYNATRKRARNATYRNAEGKSFFSRSWKT